MSYRCDCGEKTCTETISVGNMGHSLGVFILLDSIRVGGVRNSVSIYLSEEDALAFVKEMLDCTEKSLKIKDR